MRATYTDGMQTSGEHTIKFCIGNWGDCEKEVFFKLPRTWGLMNGSATSWSRDAYSDFITEESVRGGHHAILYLKTDSSGGFMKHIVLETWDFVDEAKLDISM